MGIAFFGKDVEADQVFLNLSGQLAGSLSPVLIAVLLFPSMRKKTRTVLAALTISAVAVIVSQDVMPRELEEGASFFIWVFDPVLVGVLISTVILVDCKRLERRGDIQSPTSGQGAARKRTD